MYDKPKTKREMLARLNLIPVKSRMAARNTLEYETQDGARVIRLHDTDILTFHANGAITINTGGYNTVTTRARINDFLPRDKGYVRTQKGVIHYKDTPFHERVDIGPRGAVKPDVKPRNLDALRKKLDVFMNHVKKTGLPTREQSQGDPWVFTPDQVTQDVALDWLNSKYFTRRLYALACQNAGVNAEIFCSLVDRNNGKLEAIDISRIRRFMRTRIGLA